MKRFRAFLLEQIEMGSLAFFKGPLSLDARNANVARKELLDHIENSNETDSSTNLYRGLYNQLTKKIILWFAMDGVHDSVVKMKGMAKYTSIHLYWYPRGSGKRVSIMASEAMGDKDKKVFQKFFGKNTPFVLSGDRGLAFKDDG